MGYRPISGSVPQFPTTYSGYYLKGYTTGTTTPLAMGVDKTPSSTLAKCKISSNGQPISDENDETTEFIPHFNAEYKLALYTNSTDADNNTTANAAWVVDAISLTDNVTVNGKTNTIDNHLENMEVDSYADMRAMTSSQLSDGQTIEVTDDNVSGTFVVKTGTVTDDGGTLIVFTDDSNRYAERTVNDETLNVLWFGAPNDGSSDDQTAIDNTITAAANTYQKVLIPNTGTNFVIADQLDLSSEVTLIVEGDVHFTSNAPTGNVYIKTDGGTSGAEIRSDIWCHTGLFKVTGTPVSEMTVVYFRNVQRAQGIIRIDGNNKNVNPVQLDGSDPDGPIRYCQMQIYADNCNGTSKKGIWFREAVTSNNISVTVQAAAQNGVTFDGAECEGNHIPYINVEDCDWYAAESVNGANNNHLHSGYIDNNVRDASLANPTCPILPETGTGGLFVHPGVRITGGKQLTPPSDAALWTATVGYTQVADATAANNFHKTAIPLRSFISQICSTDTSFGDSDATPSVQGVFIAAWNPSTSTTHTDYDDAQANQFYGFINISSGSNAIIGNNANLVNASGHDRTLRPKEVVLMYEEGGVQYEVGRDDKQLDSYTVAQLASFTPGSAGYLAWCSDETGGATVVYWNGSAWKRVTDGATAS